MFRSARNYRTFLTIVLTYALDLVGFSIVFPVLAPLLLNPELHFFAAGTPEAEKTTVLGVLFAFFGIAQFFGAPVAGVLADHYGRYKAFLATIGLSIFGYAIMAVSLYLQDLNLLFAGRILTGFCSGNFALAQSATADLTDEAHRPRAFGILIGVGGLGFVAGPWIGGKLANPHWLSGSGAFIFAAIAALINLAAVFFFFEETWVRKGEHAKSTLLKTFKDIRLVFHQKNLRKILTAYLIFSIGWAFFLIFSPTFLVQKFSRPRQDWGYLCLHGPHLVFYFHVRQQGAYRCFFPPNLDSRRDHLFLDRGRRLRRALPTLALLDHHSRCLDRGRIDMGQSRIDSFAARFLPHARQGDGCVWIALGDRPNRRAAGCRTPLWLEHLCASFIGGGHHRHHLFLLSLVSRVTLQPLSSPIG